MKVAFVYYYSIFSIINKLYLFCAVKVLREGHKIFTEVENSLKRIENEYVGSMLNLQGSCKRFSDIQEMLKKEQDQFQVGFFLITGYHP